MVKTLAPSVTVRCRKGAKFVSIIEDAYNKAALTHEEAQRVNDTPGLADLVGGFIAKNRSSNQYANEEVASNYYYPYGYAPKSIAEQLRVLQELFPGLNVSVNCASDPVEEPFVPGTAWFAIPRWDRIASTYNEAVKKVLSLILSKRKFHNYHESTLGEGYLRQTDRTISAWKKLGEEQSGDILIVAAQFGFSHRGRSVRCAREVMAENEFGLGAFGVGCMLLTHPEREVKWEQLHINCAGDEYSPHCDGQFSDAPIFYFYGDKMEFSVYDDAYDCFGSASWFFQ
jgi:hypothetical protein